MKKFSFKLDSVLKYREHQEKTAQIDLSDARKAWFKTQSLIEELVGEKEEILYGSNNPLDLTIKGNKLFFKSVIF